MAITNHRNKGMEVNIKNMGAFLTEQVSAKTPCVNLRSLLLDIACCMK